MSWSYFSRLKLLTLWKQWNGIHPNGEWEYRLRHGNTMWFDDLDFLTVRFAAAFEVQCNHRYAPKLKCPCTLLVFAIPRTNWRMSPTEKEMNNWVDAEADINGWEHVETGGMPPTFAYCPLHTSSAQCYLNEESESEQYY